MSVDEKRIREFAYQIWESEGKPVGQEDRHWDMARKLAEAEALAPKAPPLSIAARRPVERRSVICRYLLLNAAPPPCRVAT